MCHMIVKSGISNVKIDDGCLAVYRNRLYDSWEWERDTWLKIERMEWILDLYLTHLNVKCIFDIEEYIYSTFP